MNKNLIIFYLIIIIASLVGIIMISNYNLFSEEWIIWLSVILSSIGIGIGVTLFKIKK